MLLRQETPADYGAVYQLVAEAFATAEHADGTEQDLVAALRKSGAFIPELSIVAEIGNGLAGHILFTRAAVGGDEVLVLAPLAVRPKYQRQGVGSALIARGHEIAAELGYSYALVLGSETYYPRAGYVPAERFGIEAPEGFPSENFMAVKLRENARPVGGPVAYPKEFGL